MSEYIEKEKLIDYVQDAYGGGNEDNTCIWYGDVIEMIRSEPAADVMGDEYDLDKLRQLAQADREGRCVVLPMEKQIDICATCVHDEPGYCSVIGTIPHCCSRHWHCEPGKAAKDYVPKQEEGEEK